ncbi:MAG: peptidase T [Bacteroidetes bacterium]|nr:MAG: peptidase T [Bacteroidota bacterium]PTM11207.1 MAG: peptidase T [Bacteroidota bacterium]
MRTVLDRFLDYVKIDTQSDPDSPTHPSTAKQRDLGEVLVKELLELGLTDAHLDEHCYVYATLPATVTHEVPVICYCSHMDTSPDSSGHGVKPLVHKNYDGRDLVLPDDPTVVIRLAEHPDLAEQMGNDIVTASGTTLLGADNKAGVAEIMAAVAHLVQHPEIPHGTIKILFTPDEEIGRGVDKVDLKKLGANFAYTVDGERRGSLEDETFSADAATVIIRGISAHPGFAKGKMVSALKVAGAFLAALPTDRLAPEATTDREGFVHPVHVSGGVEETTIKLIVRDFDTAQLAHHEAELQAILDRTLTQFPGASGEIQVTEQYRNMKEVLDQHPQIVAHAEEAIRRTGLPLLRKAIRGGTDGSRLSFMGLPCPNIFAGEHAFHSKQEWVTVQDMEKVTEVLVHLAQIWAEQR